MGVPRRHRVLLSMPAIAGLAMMLVAPAFAGDAGVWRRMSQPAGAGSRPVSTIPLAKA